MLYGVAKSVHPFKRVGTKLMMYPVSRVDVQKVSDPCFSHFEVPLPMMNDRSLTTSCHAQLYCLGFEASLASAGTNPIKYSHAEDAPW